jgi:hypothetical protein
MRFVRRVVVLKPQPPQTEEEEEGRGTRTTFQSLPRIRAATSFANSSVGRRLRVPQREKLKRTEEKNCEKRKTKRKTKVNFEYHCLVS